jgi:nucleotide-binding universal stress UspA family protein
MQIKDILVHVDSSPANDARVLLALHLARRLQAHLTGLFVIPSPDLFIPPDDPAGAMTIATAFSSLQEAAVTLREQFLAMLQADQARGRWIRVTGSPSVLITRAASAADLVILGQPDPAGPTILESPADVIVGCGRPVLLVPYEGQFLEIGRHIVVAWNGSREATRAVHDALPLMEMSNDVAVVSVNPNDELKEMGSDLVHHLTHHGVNAVAEMIEEKETKATDAVLARAASFGSDLIVMGAYSHSRLRELILGGMTQDMLRRMTRPVLMAR